MTEDPPKPKDEDPAQRLARFQALLTLITTDAQLIWTRYYALLTANAIVGVVLASIAAKTAPSWKDFAVLCLLSTFGLILAWFWRGLTFRGWELQHRWVDEARKVAWPEARSPFAPYDDWCRASNSGTGTQDRIAWYAQAVITLFLVGYGLIWLVAAYGLVRHVV